ncbi:MAG: N-formylglutamate deformylase [Woeseiaceae bacterium]
MTITFSRHQGTSPLVISIPHDGRRLPPRIAARMSEAGQALPDTDWYVRKLYDFAKLSGATVNAAKYSRYVVDLNRPADDGALYEGRASSGLCPLKTFAGKAIYKEGETVSERQKKRRVARYWEPYHAELADSLAHMKEQFGYALLWEAHSIRGTLPLLFEGELPDLNIGTNDGQSCPGTIEDAVVKVAAASPYSLAVNGRFKGGFITRHYGKPENDVFAIQLELAQRSYMNETTLRYDAKRAATLSNTLGEMLTAFQEGAASVVAANA